MIKDAFGFTDAIFNARPCKTAIVHTADGKPFAEYTTEVCVDVAEDIGGYVTDKETGEITYTCRKLREILP